MKHFALGVALSLMSVAALGQTYTNANLNGVYTFQSQNSEYYTWSKTFTCPTNSQITYTPTNSTSTMQVSYGTATFDGNGNISVSITNIGLFNPSASANTMSVTWNSSCQVVSVNGGHVVYLAPATKTQSGTYSVQSTGNGSINLVGSNQGAIFQLAGTSSSTGISSTLLLTNPQTNGKSISSGIAVHQ